MAALWRVVDPRLAWLLIGVSACGWLLVLLSTFMIDHFDLFGLRQVWNYLQGNERTTATFRTPGAYRLIRHPLYAGFLIAFWATPAMTVAHALFAVATTGYILVAIQLEGAILIANFGDTYRRYRTSVPMLHRSSRSEMSHLGRLRNTLARQPLSLTTGMASLLIVMAAAQVDTTVQANSSSPLTADQARKIVRPLYTAMNRPRSRRSAKLISRATTSDWQSCGANDGCLSRGAAVAAIERLGADVPDLAWAVMDVNVAGLDDRREGGGNGHSVHEFHGVPPSGRRFRVMSIDIHTVRDGKIARSYHVEDWAGAQHQLSVP